ncbi:3',5'-cyclic-nucleotide phosphodiesterase [Umbelopsis sp. WA50703]
MDPAQCSVVVVAGCDCHLCLQSDSSSSSSYPYTSLLQQVFAQVVIENHGHAALAAIRQHLPKNGQPTLLLIDLDLCPHANQLVHPAISILQQVVKELKAGSLHDIAPVVCSNNDSCKFMLQCIQEGAADYVLKPLRKHVLKTMFLVSFLL